MGELFTFYSLTGLVNAIINISLALYIILNSSKSRIAKYLVYLCLTLAFWSTGYFLWQISGSATEALFWSRFLMAGAIMASIAFLHFVMVFLELDTKAKYRWFLFLLYIPAIFSEIANLTPYFVSGVEPRMGFLFWPTPGPLYHPFLFFFSIHVVAAITLLYQFYKRSTGRKKKQALLLLVGITITFVSGSTNYFLWYNIPILPIGNGLASAHAVLSVYAIMRYNLVKAKVLSAEVFALALLIIVGVDIFLSQSTGEFVFNIIKVIGVGLFGLVLIRSVKQEVSQKEELASITESLKTANIRLKELDRQKTEFLSIASHQLRTPLSIIKGYLELIHDGAYGKTTKKMRGILDNMDESNERLVSLVDEFLDISRIEQGRTKFHFAKDNMNGIVEDVITELTDRAKGKGLTLACKVDKTIKESDMDKEKIRHVVFNFVDNAIKYSEKGTITVQTQNESDRYTCVVRDQGLGFNKEDEANFFQKFYRGKNVEGINVNGTGLGIYVCRRFIEAHGGDVWAKSPGKGKGSEFGFSIPINFKPTVKTMKNDVQ